jgi:hypothetical protein
MRIRMAVPALAVGQRLGHNAALVAAFAFDLGMLALQRIVRALVVEGLPCRSHPKAVRGMAADAVGSQTALMSVLMTVRTIPKSQSLILRARVLPRFLNEEPGRQRRQPWPRWVTFGAAGIFVLAGQLVLGLVMNKVVRRRPGLIGMAVQAAVAQLGAVLISMAGEAILT